MARRNRWTDVRTGTRTTFRGKYLSFIKSTESFAHCSRAYGFLGQKKEKRNIPAEAD